MLSVRGRGLVAGVSSSVAVMEFYIFLCNIYFFVFYLVDFSSMDILLDHLNFFAGVCFFRAVCFFGLVLDCLVCCFVLLCVFLSCFFFAFLFIDIDGLSAA